VSATVENINRFVDYARTLQGDEKGEAQVFCDRLFQAFGHAGYKEAGATLEFRIKKESGRGTQFADLIWKPRLLKAADQIADLFKRLHRRVGEPVERSQAQRFVLQLVVAMFAEDIDLLPAGTVQTIVNDCLEHNQSPFDLFGGLFHQMNSATPARAGRFKGIRYFNGGLFSTIAPIDLRRSELELIGSQDGALLSG
jgi:hypothetical protein